MRVFACLLLVACTGTIDGPPPEEPPLGSEDPWGDLDQIKREGPPRYTSRVHSCAKIRVRTLGNLLASRGVNLAAEDELSAGKLYRSGQGALGAPAYDGRIRESIELGLATTSKIFDIFVQAAPEIIAGMAARPECAGAQLFDASNRCTDDGVSCLLGVPATSDHLAICNQTIARAPDLETGKRLAVAVLAAAAHTCE